MRIFISLVISGLLFFPLTKVFATEQQTELKNQGFTGIENVLVQHATTQTTPKQEKQQPLQLTIKSDKQIYKIDEDITIEVELKNLSDKPVHIATYFRDFSIMGEDSGLRFNIIGHNKQPVQYPDPRRALLDIMVYPKVLSLELNKELILGTKPKEWYVIDKVGKYEIKAIFRDSLKLINKLADSVDYCKDIKEECIKKGCWEGELISNTITIEVVEKGSKKVSPFNYCENNDDCKTVTDYCNCKQLCVNKFTELENCPATGKKCKSNARPIICSCENNKCIGRPMK